MLEANEPVRDQDRLPLRIAPERLERSRECLAHLRAALAAQSVEPGEGVLPHHPGHPLGAASPAPRRSRELDHLEPVGLAQALQ